MHCAPLAFLTLCLPLPTVIFAAPLSRQAINWAKLERREIESKFKPEVTKGDMDVCNFDKIWTDQAVADSPCTGAGPGAALMASHAGEDQFKGFTYVAPSYLTMEATRAAS